MQTNLWGTGSRHTCLMAPLIYRMMQTQYYYLHIFVGRHLDLNLDCTRHATMTMRTNGQHMLGVVGFPTDDPKCTYLHMERVLFCSAGRPAEKSYGESMLLTTRKRMVLDTKISRYHFMSQ